MRYYYEPGAVRWKRYDGAADITSVRPHRGWSMMAGLLDHHPITGRKLRQSQWWICETYRG